MAENPYTKKYLEDRLNATRLKKKSLKRQVEKLTWIARSAVGTDSLEAMLNEPIDYGYEKEPSCRVIGRMASPVVVGPRLQEFLRSVEKE